MCRDGRLKQYRHRHQHPRMSETGVMMMSGAIVVIANENGIDDAMMIVIVIVIVNVSASVYGRENHCDVRMIVSDGQIDRSFECHGRCDAVTFHDDGRTELDGRDE